MIIWRKKGLLLGLPQNHAFGKSHVQLPVLTKNEHQFELFFSTRNSNNVAHGARVTFESFEDLKPKFDVLPIISPGPIGAFDDMGVMPSSVVENEGDTYLYYIGWNVRNTVPYHNSIGLAIRGKGESQFTKISEGPIIERTYKEPYFNGTNSVLKEGNIWHMWYLSCTGWSIINGKPEATYLVRYAQSNNGIDWQRDGYVCIGYENEYQAIAGASVIKWRDKYIMMYCVRDIRDYRHNWLNSYKLRFAESQDGISWIKHKGNIWEADVNEPWEEEMQAYPFLFEENNRLKMLYNGNGFGQSGVGLAEAIFR